MLNKDLGIVVLSCDKFSSLWPLFFNRFERFFCSQSFNIYLLSNHTDINFSQSSLKVNLIKVGDDISWSSNLIKLIKSIPEQNLLFFMDDAPLSKEVDMNKFDNALSAFVSENMDYLNLKSSPSPNLNLKKDFGLLAPNTDYRTSIVPSLWKKEILIELLRENESAWEFEIFGSKRSKSFKNFFSLNSSVFEFDHIIVKGKIDRKVYKRLKANEEHLNLDFPVMSFWEHLKELASLFLHYKFTKILPKALVSFYRSCKYQK
jgi:hypothetical protein